MKLFRFVFFVGGVVFIGLLIGVQGCKKNSSHEGHEASQSSTIKGKYHCPMHPTYVSDKPGDCPICSMSLVPIESDEEHETMVKDMTEGKDSGNRKPLYYRHPMQPNVTSPEPKKDEMGMDYIAVYADEGSAETPVSDRATIKLSEQREQLIGVRTAPVERRNLNFLVRASGRVAYDPDLYSAIAEHREALKAREKTKESPWPDVHERAEALVDGSVLRLKQMGLSEDQINRIDSESKTPTNLLIGQAGDAVWVYAQIYEYEVGLIKAGQTLEANSSAFPGRKFRGKVLSVDSILNAETRTLRVRAEVPNPEGLLKPEMYVDTVIRVELGQKLAIPEEALVDTGTRQLVFVEKVQGQYEPREVEIGHEAEGYYEVRSGLKEGEMVVASANFLIDSESRLKAAVSEAGKHQH